MATKRFVQKLFRRYSWKTISAVGVILLACVLIEAISLVRYRYTYQLFEKELDYRAESELTLKSVRVRGILKSNEKLLRNRVWDISQSLDHPDSIYGIARRIVETNGGVINCFVAFCPDYYPSRGRLFEPTASRQGDSVVVRQMGSDTHDYTQREFYQLAVEDDQSCWSDPYLDQDASGQQVTTYATPITDATGKTVAALGIDLSTRGIVDTLNMRHNYPSTFFLLLTEDGELISHPDSTHKRYDDVDGVVRMVNDSTCERHLSSSGKSQVITFKGKKSDDAKHIYHANMRGKPHWQVIMVSYDSEVYAELKDMRRNMLLLMLAGMALLGFILYRYNRNIRHLHESTLSKERTESELRVAKNIQTEMLPQLGISRADVDVSGKVVTALEVGGDLYDYLIRDEKLYFCIGDVSGKGVPSSLVMAVVHSHFRSLTQHESNPARIMRILNLASCQGNDANMFVTMFIGVLDLPTGRLRYCNAGHDAPLLIAGEVKPLPVNANLPVGLFDDFVYGLQEVLLPDEATLLLYTDGLTETFDTEQRLFGLQRVIETAQQCLERDEVSPNRLLEAVRERARQFAGGAQQSDDLTMLAVHYHRPDEKTVLDDTLSLTNDVRRVSELNSFVQSVCDRLNIDPSVASQLKLAAEEAVVNVMSYAYPVGTQGDVTVGASATEQKLKLVITDSGKAFDPTQSFSADTTLSAEERPIGGLGILLVRSLTDTVNYDRYDGKNILTIQKAYNKPKE